MAEFFKKVRALFAYNESGVNAVDRIIYHTIILNEKSIFISKIPVNWVEDLSIADFLYSKSRRA
jgi:hypothetical protein